MELADGHVTWQVTSHHSRIEPFDDNAIVVNGHLTSATLPAKLRNLPHAPIGANADARRRYQEDWNKAARYRYTPHGRTDANGTTRFRVSRLHAAQAHHPAGVPARTRHLPIHAACDRKTASTLVYLTGRTAHEIACFSQRNVTESAHSAFRGGFVSLDNGHFRVFGLAKINTLLGFTIAGYKCRRISAFSEELQLDDPNNDDVITAALRQNDAPADAPHETTSTGGTDPPG